MKHCIIKLHEDGSKEVVWNRFWYNLNNAKAFHLTLTENNPDATYLVENGMSWPR